MKRVISLCILLFCTIVTAQRDKASVAARTTDFTTKLEGRNINNYFTTTRHCNGDTQMFVMPDNSRCFSQGTYAATYVVWMENNKAMLKKIDNCGMFASVALPDTELYQFFEAHAQALQQNKVKPYAIEGREGGPISRTEIKDCHRAYRFVYGNAEGIQQFKPFDLTNSAREKNINFNYNQALHITILETMMDNAITFLENSPNYLRL